MYTEFVDTVFKVEFVTLSFAKDIIPMCFDHDFGGVVDAQNVLRGVGAVQ